MTMTVSGSPPASLQIAYANNSGTNITFFDLRPNADGTAFTVGSAGPILNGTTLIYNPVCIDQIKGSVENNNPVGGGTLNDLWPAEPGFAWTGLNFVPPPPPPPPEPNTELTLRDEKLIAIEITLGLIYILTKPFVFRQHE